MTKTWAQASDASAVHAGGDVGGLVAAHAPGRPFWTHGLHQAGIILVCGPAAAGEPDYNGREPGAARSRGACPWPQSETAGVGRLAVCAWLGRRAPPPRFQRFDQIVAVDGAERGLLFGCPIYVLETLRDVELKEAVMNGFISHSSSRVSVVTGRTSPPGARSCACSS